MNNIVTPALANDRVNNKNCAYSYARIELGDKGFYISARDNNDLVSATHAFLESTKDNWVIAHFGRVGAIMDLSQS